MEGTTTRNGEVRGVGDIAQDLAGAARELYERIDLGRELQEHPYRTLALAAFAGYVVGGGLFTPLTGQMLRVGARVAMLPVVQSALFGGGQGPEGPPGYGP